MTKTYFLIIEDSLIEDSPRKRTKENIMRLKNKASLEPSDLHRLHLELEDDDEEKESRFNRYLFDTIDLYQEYDKLLEIYFNLSSETSHPSYTDYLFCSYKRIYNLYFKSICDKEDYLNALILALATKIENTHEAVKAQIKDVAAQGDRYIEDFSNFIVFLLVHKESVLSNWDTDKKCRDLKKETKYVDEPAFSEQGLDVHSDAYNEENSECIYCFKFER
jgi:hypothetical protein